MTGERALLLAIVAVGLALRVPGAFELPVEFHPARQYHGADLIRRLAPGLTDAPSAVAADAARRQAASVEPIEPPVLEAASAAGWRLAGRELLWLPRVLSALAWAGAGLLLYALGRAAHSRLAGAVAAAYVTLLPYGLRAGRSIQPEPLLLAVSAAALLALWRWREAPTSRRLVVAGAAAGAAVFVKVVAVFVVGPAFLALALGAGRGGGRWSLPGRAVATFAALAAGPALVWHAVAAAAGILAGQTSGRIAPRLLATADFWSGWATNADAVFVLAFVGLAAAATATAAPGPLRRLLVGLAAGYLAHGLTFSYHTQTHDYYQLPFLPWVALGVGVGTAAAATWLWRRGWAMHGVAATVAVPAFFLFVVVTVPRLVVPRDTSWVADDAATIAATVGHRDRLLLLAPGYGRHLAFAGPFEAGYWEPSANAAVRAAAGRPDPPAADRLAAAVDAGCRWFVADVRLLAVEPELVAALGARARLAADGPRYRIYDLEAGP